MSEKISVKVHKAILHILDANVDIPVLSVQELELESDVLDFIEKHMSRVFNDNNVRTGCFDPSDNAVYEMIRSVANDANMFVDISLELSDRLFTLMKQHVDIPPADVIFCIVDDGSSTYFAIMKLNYKSSYIHHVTSTEEGNVNLLIKQRTTLPNDTQRIDECVIVNLSSLELKILEKQYEINGQKDYYLSSLFLKCSSELSNAEKIKVINKATQKISKKYYEDDFDKIARLRVSVAESLEESNAIQVDTVADHVFEDSYEIRKEYKEEIEKAGLKESTIEIPETASEVKKFRTHKLKTDTGIEVNFPYDYYNNSEYLEFVNNPDGTISIVLKNINKISTKL